MPGISWNWHSLSRYSPSLSISPIIPPISTLYTRILAFIYFYNLWICLLYCEIFIKFQNNPFSISQRIPPPPLFIYLLTSILPLEGCETKFENVKLVQLSRLMEGVLLSRLLQKLKKKIIFRQSCITQHNQWNSVAI